MDPAHATAADDLRPVSRTRASGQAPARPAGRPGSAPVGPAGRRPRPPADAPDRPQRDVHALGLAQLFACLYLEVESGRRPAAQLAPLVDPELFARLQPVWVRPGPPGRVVRVTGAPTAAGHFEAVAIVRRRERFGALALRLTWRVGRWRVEQAVRPEDGPLPAPAVPVAADEPSEDQGRAARTRLPAR